MTSISDLNKLSSAGSVDFSKCIDTLDASFVISGVDAKVRLHHLKFNGNGEPMVKALANLLYEFIIDYCIASRNRDEPLTSRQSARLAKEARGLFRKPAIDEDNPDRTGEAGEVLLFFLVEAVLNAPQIVAKMELKTNHKDEVKGSDGIHARWNEEDGIVDFFFGEAKLYQDALGAISSLLKSIKEFHDISMYEHEFNMVTKHFKYADDTVRDAVCRFIANGDVGEKARINHACLVGYNFDAYQNAAGGGDALREDFQAKLLERSETLVKALQKRFDKFGRKKLVFEVFFLPFPSVDAFRNAFNEALD
jgi:hypothetical protein